MNMKKIAILALSLCMIAAIAVTGTIAYFTDTDAQKNVFTTGNVAIDLYEDFGDNDAEGVEELIPATGSAQAGTLKNGIEKEVYVMNTGSEDAFVRVHIAIPSILDNGDPTFDAGKNVLHFNGADGTYANGKWNWSNAKDGNDNLTDGMINDDAKWNFYKTEINGKNYNVYVVTYETALVTDQSTEDAIYQVYLDSKVTNEDITHIKGELGEKWCIYVAAEGIQAAGFEDAYTALNTEFGDPSADDYTPNVDFANEKNRKFIDVD